MIVCRLSCIREAGFASVRRPCGRQPPYSASQFGPVGFAVDKFFPGLVGEIRIALLVCC